MTKARRMMEEDIRLVDLVIELTDARCPASSRNPDIDRLAAGKSRLILLNKADLADEASNRAWEAHFRQEGRSVLCLDSRNNRSARAVMPAIMKACEAKLERDKKRGISGRPVRAMVAGIPNVGKSTFINSLAGKAAAKTGNKPGVTRGRQWIRLNRQVELLDTPGILWPKFDDPQVGIRLALISAVRDEVLDRYELSLWLVRYLQSAGSAVLRERYALPEGCNAEEALLVIAQSRGCMKKGGEPDPEKAGALLLDDLRSGRLGRVTLEHPEGEEAPHAD